MNQQLSDIRKAAPELSESMAMLVYNYEMENCVVDWSATSWQQLRADVLWMAQEVSR